MDPSCFHSTSASAAATIAPFGESTPTSSSSSTIHVYFSPSPWENGPTQSLALMTMNRQPSSSSSQGCFSTDSVMEEMMTVSRSSEIGAASQDNNPDRTQLATSARHSDVVDRWVEVHFQSPLSSCRVRGYIPPMFNIHSRGLSIEGRHNHHNRHGGHRRSRHPGVISQSGIHRPTPNFASGDLTERNNLFKLKKTTAMKRVSVVTSASRLSRERRRTTPAFAALGGYSPLSTRIFELDTIHESNEEAEGESERNDSGVASAAGEEYLGVMWCMKLNEIENNIKKEIESMESSEKLCDKLCMEMAELPISDQPSAETMVTQSFASLAVSDGNRKAEKRV